MIQSSSKYDWSDVWRILSWDVGWNLMQQSTGVCSGGYNRLRGHWNRFQSIIHNTTLGYISLRMLLRGWHTVGQLSTLFNVITWKRTAINNRGQYTINIQQSTTMCCSQSSKECSHEKRGLLYMICYGEDIKHYQRIGYIHNQPRGTVAQSTKIVTHCLGIHAMIASSIFTDCSSQSNTYNRLLIK